MMISECPSSWLCMVSLSDFLDICTKINCNAVDWQYDLSVTTFSPDGRVFQIEYATKAVDNSGYDWIRSDD